MLRTTRRSFSDCLEWNLKFPFLKDGVYTIFPDGTNGVKAFCDMESGGWTVSIYIRR